MSSQPPPVPSEQQSDKVEGASSPADRKPEVARESTAPGGGPQGKASDRIRETTRSASTQDR